jgi:hypothetical protein
MSLGEFNHLVAVLDPGPDFKGDATIAHHRERAQVDDVILQNAQAIATEDGLRGNDQRFGLARDLQLDLAIRAGPFGVRPVDS